MNSERRRTCAAAFLLGAILLAWELSFLIGIGGFSLVLGILCCAWVIAGEAGEIVVTFRGKP